MMAFAAPAAEARPPALTGKQIDAGLNAAANRLVQDGERIYRQRATCGRVSRTKARCGIVLEREGEGGYQGPLSDWAPPGTCEVGVTVGRDRQGVYFTIRFAHAIHMQGICPKP